MSTQAIFTAGYYALESTALGWAQHTYVVARANGKEIRFPCYGGVDTGHRESGSVYPADLFTPSLTDYRKVGRQASGDLDLARAIVTGDPKAPHRDNYGTKLGGVTGLGDNCGIVYGVTGVCHQMAARVLYACTGTPIVWPPTVTATYWKFFDPIAGTGFYGGGWALFQLLIPRYSSALAAATASTGADSPGVAQHLEAVQDPQVRGPHIRGILASRLGADLADLHAPACLEKDHAFEVQKRDLDMQLLRGQITNGEFAEASNRGFARLAREIADVVGGEAYQRVFGLPPEQDLTLSIDPAMMPESYQGLA